MWSKLKLIHEQDSSESIHALHQRFYKCGLSEGESIASFVSNIEVIVNQLAGRGDTTFTEQAIIAKIMSSLPVGYDNVLSAWDTTPEASKTLDTFTLRMYQQEARLKTRQKTSNEKVTAFAANSSKNGGKESKGSSKNLSNDPNFRSPSSRMNNDRHAEKK